jgi:cobalamin synthase
MTRTQKTAWLNVSGFLASMALFSYLFITIFALKRLPNRAAAVVVLLLFGAQFAWWIFVLRKKQSPAEPEADERDKAIMRNAVLVSFLSTWLLLAVATLLPALILGQAGCLPVFLLPFINFGVFLIAGQIYFVAVLVQYGRGRKGEQL